MVKECGGESVSFFRFQDDLEAVAAGVRQSIDQLEKQISSVVSEVKQIKRAEKDRSADIYQILVEMRKQNGALEVTQRDMVGEKVFLRMHGSDGRLSLTLDGVVVSLEC